MIALIGYVSLLAVILAYWEIQIEGRDGWAKNLPTWKKYGLIAKLQGGSPLTGYHLSLDIFLLAILHMPFLFWPWNIQAELFIWGLMAYLLVLEDFLWFILNPHYGIRKFKRGEIPWHRKWIGPIPHWYLYYIPVAMLLLYLGYPGMPA